MRFKTGSFSPKNMKKKKKKKKKTEVLDGNNTSQPLQTVKVCMDFSHLSCRKVVRELKEFLSEI